MTDLEGITKEYTQRVIDLCRQMPTGSKIAVLTTFYDSYEVHKTMHGSFKHLMQSNAEEYSTKMAERIHFMYGRADLLARQLKNE